MAKYPVATEPIPHIEYIMGSGHVKRDGIIYPVVFTNATDINGNQLYIDSISWEMQMDYQARTDTQPVYLGYAAPGSATSSDVWVIHKFTYDGSNRATRRQVVTETAWDDRVAAF